MDTREYATALLKKMLGQEAEFRDGQLEAISAVIDDKERVLLVQRTGWGKSIVYFITTAILREQKKKGPTLLVSPLLALMRDQARMAVNVGVQAEFFNSDNSEDWGDIEARLRKGEIDLLMISPERLGNQRFREQTLPALGSIGLLVVDEAHCISDWGHDFRPDYRRINRILKNKLLEEVPIIATTATANNRVVNDIVEQLGASGLKVVRGPMERESLRLQNIRLRDQAERLSWLAENLPRIPGTGIIYCLTIADCRRVAAWLRSRGIDAREYHADLKEGRGELEELLRSNKVKVLVATVALGMGFDKPDLSFVIHFQRPGSLIAEYQQIGRAGRELDVAWAVLLNGKEDDDIQDYFIRTAFPGPDNMLDIRKALMEADTGLTVRELLGLIDISYTRMEKCLKHLEVEEAIYKEGSRYFPTLNPWKPDLERAERITAQRYEELQRMREYVENDGCLMEFICRELDDPQARPCGRCASCAGPHFPGTVKAEVVREAQAFLKHDCPEIAPRKQWLRCGINGFSGRIPAHEQNQPGRALCYYGDAGWGRMVHEGKYENEPPCYDQQLVAASAEFILKGWLPAPFPEWVTVIPSRRHPELVPDFAQRLANELGLPFYAALDKTLDNREQKEIENSEHQLANVALAFRVNGKCPNGPVLLVDDMVDSGWTFTVCGSLLLSAGSKQVFPFALAKVINRSALPGGERA